jgi:hypothetical protein
VRTDWLGDRSGAGKGEFEGGDIGGVFGLLFGGEVAVVVYFEGAGPEHADDFGARSAGEQVTISENCCVTERVMVQYRRWL